ncbi:MAG: SPOC like C-terminal domain-containing protein [Benjaminiella poitrasii]|nr:MAG: SPOC like C-terminal domain-containing protein [Benjaminiella poitrasii]
MAYNDYNSNNSSEYFDEEYIDKVEDEFNFKECIVYAIDCRPSMLEPNEHDEIPLLVALKSIRSKCLDKINSRSNDQMAIILFGTLKNNNSANKEYIFVLQSLDTLDAPRIKEIDMLINNFSSVKKQYGSTDLLFPISDLFWVCSDILLSAPKLSTKRVILITDNDDPTNGNPIFRKTAIQRAKDLNNVKVECILLGLDRYDHDFDKDLFYKDICYFDDVEDEFEDKILSCTGKLNDLFEKIKSLQTTTRSEFRLPLQITPSLIIGIRGYNMIIEQKIGNPKYFCTSGEQLKEVKYITRWKCVDTNENVTQIDMKTSYNYGGEKVVFSKQDIEMIQTINEPGLRILGFRDSKALKANHQISHPYFIYPDESQYKEMNAIPKIVALLPQAEKLDKGDQTSPPGFQLIVLPFADEIRSIPPYTVPQGYEHASNTAKQLIEKFKITEGYNPMKYHNSYLQSHKNMIQKIALDSDDVFNDSIIPDYQFIESKLSDEIKAFKKYVGLDTIRLDDLMSANSSAKQKASPLDNELPYKKLKTEELTVPQHWKANTLNKVTNASLKEFLISVGVQPKKLKSELVCQVDGYLKIKLED